MFKRFTTSEISGHSQVKTSVQRNIRKKILTEYPSLTQEIETLLPKKTPLYELKWSPGHVSLVVVNGEILFFNIRDGQYLPTLRVLQKYPDLLPKVQVDRGAIKYVLQGAQIMCPGLTSKGGNIESPVETEVAVAIMAEGKVHALGIGITKLSTLDMKRLNKGIGVENVHHLGDGLWQTPTITS